MSRSGYSDDYENSGALNCYRANIDRATNGRRGQAFFRELAAALDAMPEKRLTSGDLEVNGEVCALGAVRRFRGIELSDAIAQSDWDELGKVFNVAPMLTQEVMYENDEGYFRGSETPEQRWQRMRDWAQEQIRAEPVTPAATREGGRE